MTPDRDQVLRGLLRALGYNPETHVAEVVRHQRERWSGVRVSLYGEPVRFHSLASIRKLYKDQQAQAEFERECPREESK